MSQSTGAESRVFESFETMAIVGVGLIGGSIALAAKERRIARCVLGVGRDRRRLEEARRRGMIDEGFLDLAEAARRADLVVFCTPVDRIAADVHATATDARPGTLFTDVGSIKARLCRELSESLPNGAQFVGAHPLAGSEKRGFENANAGMFENRVCIVTPVETTPHDAANRVAGFWQSLGADVVEMSPERHDRALGETSHLPHLAAAALAGMLSDENRPFTATGFRDTTRIASGDPDLWSAIFLGNRTSLLDSLARYEKSLARFRAALEQNDADAMKELLKAAKMSRDALAGG